MATRLTRVERGVREIARALDARGRAWALVGGLAVSARAEPRTTRDVDVAVAVLDDADAERLVADLRGAGFEVLATVEQRERDRLATVRLGAARVQHVVERGFARGRDLDALLDATIRRMRAAP
jgi:hypothetical protein